MLLVIWLNQYFISIPQKTAESQTQTLNGYLVLPKQDFSWNCLSMKAISPFSDLILVNS